MSTNPLLDCQTQGYCILTEGTMDPAVVLPRLLGALSILSREAPADAATLGIPSEAMADEVHTWWDSAAADAVLIGIMSALDEQAPEGFMFTADGAWDRLGFFPGVHLPSALDTLGASASI